MRVVLLDNIRGVGQVGDIKEVSDGYARNFLLPRKAAKPVTDGILKEVAAIKAKKLQAVTLEQEQAKALAAKLTDTRIELSGRANEQGTLFAAIESEEIAAALSKASEIQIPAKAIKLAEPIKAVGEHTVSVEVTEGIAFNIIVVVSAGK